MCFLTLITYNNEEGGAESWTFLAPWSEQCALLGWGHRHRTSRARTVPKPPATVPSAGALWPSRRGSRVGLQPHSHHFQVQEIVAIVPYWDHIDLVPGCLHVDGLDDPRLKLLARFDPVQDGVVEPVGADRVVDAFRVANNEDELELIMVQEVLYHQPLLPHCRRLCFLLIILAVVHHTASDSLDLHWTLHKPESTLEDAKKNKINKIELDEWLNDADWCYRGIEIEIKNLEKESRDLRKKWIEEEEEPAREASLPACSADFALTKICGSGPP